MRWCRAVLELLSTRSRRGLVTAPTVLRVPARTVAAPCLPRDDDGSDSDVKPSFLRWMLRSLGRSLVALGMQYTGPEPHPYPPPRTPVLRGPAPHHPERLRPDLPLTPLERALIREWEAS